MRGPPNRWLLAGGWLSAAAAVLHLACIAGGPDGYRFLGAGESMARLAERGSPVPALLTLGIAGVLAVWAAYAFAGAGVIPRLPLMRAALAAISAVYLLRGAVLFTTPFVDWPAGESFVAWSSAIVLVYGVAYAVGTWRAWRTLRPGTRHAGATG